MRVQNCDKQFLISQRQKGRSRCILGLTDEVEVNKITSMKAAHRKRRSDIEIEGNGNFYD